MTGPGMIIEISSLTLCANFSQLLLCPHLHYPLLDAILDLLLELHICLKYSSDYKYCAVCKALKRNYNKMDKYCIQCKVLLCFTHTRDCLATWHSAGADDICNKYLSH